MDDGQDKGPLWCPVCRVHLTEAPCLLCELRAKGPPEEHFAVPPLPDDAEEPLTVPLAEVLPTRTVNALEERGLLYVWDLLHVTREQLATIPNFGPLTLQMIFDALRRLKLVPPPEKRAWHEKL